MWEFKGAGNLAVPLRQCFCLLSCELHTSAVKPLSALWTCNPWCVGLYHHKYLKDGHIFLWIKELEFIDVIKNELMCYWNACIIHLPPTTVKIGVGLIQAPLLCPQQEISAAKGVPSVTLILYYIFVLLLFYYWVWNA